MSISPSRHIKAFPGQPRAAAADPLFSRNIRGSCRSYRFFRFFGTQGDVVSFSYGIFLTCGMTELDKTYKAVFNE